MILFTPPPPSPFHWGHTKGQQMVIQVDDNNLNDDSYCKIPPFFRQKIFRDEIMLHFFCYFYRLTVSIIHLLSCNETRFILSGLSSEAKTVNFFTRI